MAADENNAYIKHLLEFMQTQARRHTEEMEIDTSIFADSDYKEIIGTYMSNNPETGEDDVIWQKAINRQLDKKRSNTGEISHIKTANGGKPPFVISTTNKIQYDWFHPDNKDQWNSLKIHYNIKPRIPEEELYDTWICIVSTNGDALDVIPMDKIITSIDNFFQKFNIAYSNSNSYHVIAENKHAIFSIPNNIDTEEIKQAISTAAIIMQKHKHELPSDITPLFVNVLLNNHIPVKPDADIIITCQNG